MHVYFEVCLAVTVSDKFRLPKSQAWHHVKPHLHGVWVLQKHFSRRIIFHCIRLKIDSASLSWKHVTLPVSFQWLAWLIFSTFNLVMWFSANNYHVATGAILKLYFSAPSKYKQRGSDNHIIQWFYRQSIIPSQLLIPTELHYKIKVWFNV